MSDHTPAAIDEKYIDLVAQLVRGKLPDNIARQMISDDAEAQRMYFALVSLKKDVEAQLAEKRARDVQKRHEFEQRGDDGTRFREYRARDDAWRAKAIRFLSSIEEHILATKERIRDYNLSQQGNNTQLAEIKRDIAAHREEIAEDEASEADKRLWQHAQ